MNVILYVVRRDEITGTAFNCHKSLRTSGTCTVLRVSPKDEKHVYCDFARRPEKARHLAVSRVRDKHEAISSRRRLSILHLNTSSVVSPPAHGRHFIQYTAVHAQTPGIHVYAMAGWSRQRRSSVTATSLNDNREWFPQGYVPRLRTAKRGTSSENKQGNVGHGF